MKEIILVGAEYCAACKAMKAWFFNTSLKGVTLLYEDLESEAVMGEKITSLPAIIFRESGEKIQILYGAMTEHDLIKKTGGLWPDTQSEEE